MKKMTIDEIIKDLSTIGDYFKEETDGCIPVCIPEAIKLLEQLKKEEEK